MFGNPKTLQKVHFNLFNARSRSQQYRNCYNITKVSDFNLKLFTIVILTAHVKLIWFTLKNVLNIKYTGNFKQKYMCG